MLLWHDKFHLDTTFFTADTHVGHKNLARGTSNWEDKSSCRDFDTIEDMNNAIIESINCTVSEDDFLFCLGDWSFGDIGNVRGFRNQIHCKKIALILGNHDTRIRWSSDLRNIFYWTGDYLEIAPRRDCGMDVPSLIILSHYAMRVWNGSHRSSVQLFGHSHGTLPSDGKQMDVGWDVWKRPLSLREVLENLKDKPVNIIDHHNVSTA